MRLGKSMQKVDIENNDILLRRIPIVQILYDEKLKRHRPISGAFDNTTNTNEMSIDVEKLLKQPSDSIKSYPNNGLIKFTAQFAYDLKQKVEHQPLDNNYAHGAVIGKKTKKEKRKFAKECEWVIKPKGL